MTRDRCARHQSPDAVWCQVADELSAYMQLLCVRCIDELRSHGATVLILPEEVDDAD